jgi:hypothetical protein
MMNGSKLLQVTNSDTRLSPQAAKELQKYFALSYAYAKTLKAKPSKKKS